MRGVRRKGRHRSGQVGLWAGEVGVIKEKNSVWGYPLVLYVPRKEQTGMSANSMVLSMVTLCRAGLLSPAWLAAGTIGGVELCKAS